MNHCKAPLFIALLVTLGLTACGGDSGSSPGRDEDPSSSSQNASSFSQGASSSSSSYTEDPNDSTRAATWADLKPVMDLGDEMGLSVRYVLGKSGVFSKLYYSGTGLAGQITGLYTLQADGSVLFDTSRSGAYAIGNSTSGNALRADLASSPSRLFRVHKTSGVLYAGKDRSSWKAVQAATLTSVPTLVSEPSEMSGLWTRSNGDTLASYALFADGSYVREARFAIGDTLWEAGRWDVQNQYLVLVPEAFHSTQKALNSVYYFHVGKASIKWSELGSTSETAYTRTTLSSGVDASLLAKAWNHLDSSYYWTLTLGAAEASLTAVGASAATASNVYYQDKAYWRLYGDYLLLDFSSYAGSCSGISGTPIGGGTCFSALLSRVQVGDSLMLSQGSIPASWGR